MMEFVKLTTKDAVLQTLLDFSDVFPHLGEKIDSMDAYAEKLSRFAQCWAGTEADAPVGLVIFYANDLNTRTAYISLIGVQKAMQGKGVGQRLMTHCAETAKALGMQQLSLEVDCDNLSAQRFYQKNGFTFSGNTERNSMYLTKSLV